MKADSQPALDGARMFQKLLNAAFDKLEQKNAVLTLIRLAELDSILTDIEKMLTTSRTINNYK
jgi:hypothetical protein